jgi:hypothetical protein
VVGRLLARRLLVVVDHDDKGPATPRDRRRASTTVLNIDFSELKNSTSFFQKLNAFCTKHVSHVTNDMLYGKCSEGSVDVLSRWRRPPANFSFYSFITDSRRCIHASVVMEKRVGHERVLPSS